ncbi:MAG: glycosyltransferase family 4 protein [Gammaproteobacteria bacterium]|nr:glycosyltransferase family 4 protein [Gammaproteobacteria bacterium]
MPKLLILSKYDTLGASSRLRLYQYIPYLKQNNFQVEVSALLNNKYLEKLYVKNSNLYKTIIVGYMRRIFKLLSFKSFDAILIEGELFPWLPFWFEKFFLCKNIPYIIDYDDALFHRYDQNRNYFIRKFFGKKIDYIMRSASLVVVGNEYLKKWAGSAGAKKVELLPTVIDLDRYNLKPFVPRKTFSIGWIGTPKTSLYLKLLASVLKKISSIINMQLVVIGDVNFQLEGIKILPIPWKEDKEVNLINNYIDVGIMPLKDTPWEQGKCGYKLIQYMACQKPVIASPIGVNKEIIKHGVNGYLASTEKEWFENIMSLYGNISLRKRIGKLGRLAVEQKYCLQVTAPKFIFLLQDIINNKSNKIFID